MTRWDDLYSTMRGFEAERLEAERRRRAAEAAREELDAWAASALAEVWGLVRAALGQRGDEFARATGRRVEIVAHPPAMTGDGELPALHVIELRLETSTVYVYTHHFSGAPPHVHLGYWPSSEGSRRHHRMLSLALGTLERRADGGWLLRRSVPATSRQEVAVDDLVFRAFELLVYGVVRTDPRVFALRALSAEGVRSGHTLPLGTR